jgi:hypothetical protein
MKAETNDDSGKLTPGCNVNSTFNFTVGGLAIAAAVLLGYLSCAYWFN